MRDSRSCTDDDPTVVDEIAAFIRRFVFLKYEALYLLIALWVIVTHLKDEFDYLGYLFFYSPERQSGKTKALEVLRVLVWMRTGLLVSPSAAVLFRTASERTQLLDEIDSWTNSDELRGLLNAGFQRDGVVTRMRQVENGGYVPGDLSVCGPRALAGIGLETLDDTTRDRAFAIKMFRQTKAERREKFRVRKLAKEIEDLWQYIEAAAVAYREEVQELYDNADFSYLEVFHDRTEDISEPLATILEVIFQDDHRLPDLRRQLVEAIAITRQELQTDLRAHRIIRELARLSEDEDPLVGNSTELRKMCSKALQDEVTIYDLSSTLRNYGFRSKPIRTKGTPEYRYVLPYKELADIVERYAGSEDDDE